MQIEHVPNYFIYSKKNTSKHEIIYSTYHSTFNGTQNVRSSV